MTQPNERDFKGVWIPAEVWLDDRLTALDKIILTEIDSLDTSERGCYASNAYIADFCQCSEAKVSKSISLLIKLGYVYLQHFDGRQRELKSRFTKNAKLPCKIYEADSENLQESNTYINTDIKTDNNNISVQPKKQKADTSEYDTEFETLWKQYPRKIGKPKALKAYIKARKGGTTFEAVQAGLNAYVKQISANKTETAYIKHGSTWFNGECWNDDYSGGNVPATGAGQQNDVPDFLKKWSV